MIRSAPLITMCMAVLGLCGPALVHPAPRLIWNATASTPIGLYTLKPAGHLRLGELVIVRPPAPLSNYLADGGFLPKGVPLMKHIAALPGQIVCRHDAVVTVDGVVMGKALARDHLRRPLPAWCGCRRLAPGMVFVMNRTVPDSLDGRYFGPLPAGAIVGHAIPLWTSDHRHSDFVWRARTR